MSHRFRVLAGLILLLTAPGLQAQTNLYSFTANDGTFYRRIKIIRVDDDGVLYMFSEGAGGGRLKFSQLPESVVDEIKSMKEREKTFADSLSAPTEKSAPAAEAASSNRGGNGDKSDSATLVLSNTAAHAICTFSRMISTNGIDYRIAVTYYGTNYLGLGSGDSLTLDADGALVTYSPVPGTHRVEAGASDLSETQVYKTSLRDIQRICQAQSLGMALSGPLGNDDFAVPPGSILKNFGHYCLTNASAVAVRPGNAANSNAAAMNTSTNASAEPPPAEVLEATAKTIDADSFTTQWAWKVTLRAAEAPPKEIFMEIQFLDADGYVLAREVEYPVKLRAGQTNTLTGQAAIKTALSGRVKTCKVVMK